jgi:hypothetical protein
MHGTTNSERRNENINNNSNSNRTKLTAFPYSTKSPELGC